MVWLQVLALKNIVKFPYVMRRIKENRGSIIVLKSVHTFLKVHCVSDFITEFYTYMKSIYVSFHWKILSKSWIHTRFWHPVSGLHSLFAVFKLFWYLWKHYVSFWMEVWNNAVLQWLDSWFSLKGVYDASFISCSTQDNS